MITEVFDVKGWIAESLENVHGHSTPHCFKFVKQSGKVLMFFKSWSSDPWCEESKAIVLLKVHELNYNGLTRSMHTQENTRLMIDHKKP